MMTTEASNNFRHLFIVSGPSGAGKAAIMAELLQRTSLRKVVTYATRRPRSNEQPGVDYNFVSLNDFNRLVSDGTIIETVQVYADHFYGSPGLTHEPTASDRLVELDPEGHARYQSKYGSKITGIFLLPPSLQELRRRIEARHAETNLDRRLRAAVEQLGRAQEYDYVLVNDDITVASAAATAIVCARQQQLDRDAHLRFAAALRREFADGVALA
jgi:guanylate kinase